MEYIRRHQQTSHLTVLILCTFIVFVNSLTGEFILDDWPIIVNNPKIRSFEFIVDYFTSGVWSNSGLLNEKDHFLYRPFFLLFVNLVYQAFGPNSVVFHIFCISFHVANSVLVYFTIKMLFRNVSPALLLFAALVFALHPIHTESVSWISGITDLMVTFFMLLSFLCYIRFRHTSLTRYFYISIICFVFALLSKEVAAVLPLLYVAYDYLVFKKTSFKLSIYYFIMLGVYFIVRTLALGKTIAVSQYELSAWVNLFDFIVAYVKLLWIPWPIHVYFAIPEQGIAGTAGYIVTAISIALIGYGIARIKNNKHLWFGLIWFVITLLPGLSLAFLSSPMFAVRFLYLPSVGFILMLVWFLSQFEFKTKAPVVLAVMSILILYSISTILLNRDWNNEEVFYQKILNLSPRHEGALAKLAQYYQRKGRDDQAIPMFIKAAKYGTAKTKIIAFESIGLIYGMRGNFQESVNYYSKALSLDSNRSSVLVGLGNNALQQKQYNKALHYYQRAYAANSNNYGAVYNLYLVYQILGQTNKADYYKNLADSMPKGWVY